ncbi:class I SAM-dependent methyltransferase [Bacillus sp. BRMEA1]|uniref:class I SAM-dependent methyltransferase n=1 Tax=Neobacillus endophyticus TaxID=2738405 RepID=UPI001567A622|nr:class I SAM-dependent methyltransferase [Neobacillus endophyticus]NRD80358.1 class I SAM-dependent methyltransferase [Neobacillus endophyticus]
MGGLTYIDFLAKFGVGGAHPGGILLTKSMLTQENIKPGATILDAGCGTGQTAAYLSQHFQANVVGIELNPIMVEKARSRFQSLQLPVQLVQGSIENIPFPDNTFDFILCESVLAFVNKPIALNEFYRVLKNNGRLIANEMTINSKLSQSDEEEIKEFYAIDSLLLEEDWKRLLTDSGFQNIEINAPYMDLLQGSPSQEFNFSQNFEPELFSILNQHGNMLVKYHDTLSHRAITCTKP